MGVDGLMKDRIDVNEGIWELCKYQHDLIKQYKEFIEKTILVKILENYTPAKDSRPWFEQEYRVHEVEIPATRFMALQTPRLQRNWEMLAWDTPVVKPEIYLNLMYKAAEEQKKNAEAD